MKTTYTTDKALKQAHDLFGVKSFADEFAGLKTACKWLSWPLSLISIVTGYGFLYYRFEGSLGASLAVVVSLIILVSVELLKKYIGALAFTNFYKDKGMFTAALTLFTAALMVLSIYMSVLGAEELIYKTSDKIERIEANYLIERDSIHNHFTTLIEAEKKALEAYTKSVSWKGQVDVSNKATQSAILRHNQRIQSLESESLKILEISRINKENTRSTTTQEVNKDAGIFMALAGIVEIAIMLCVWFVIYYYYIVRMEAEKELWEATNGTMRTINVGASEGYNPDLLDALKKNSTLNMQQLCKTFRVNPSIVKKHKELLNA